jgi:hypothetical protein
MMREWMHNVRGAVCGSDASYAVPGGRVGLRANEGTIV